MLIIDNNKYIPQIYFKSVDLYNWKEAALQEYLSNNELSEHNEYFSEDEEDDRLDYMIRSVSTSYHQALYKEIKALKTSDIYLFEQNFGNKVLLTHNEQFIPYPRKDNLKKIIQKVMKYQEDSDLVDYHKYPKRRWTEQQQDIQVVKVRNIVHQSLQLYNKLFTKSQKQKEIDAYFNRLSENCGLDQWGQYNIVSSQFLWLPAEFIYSEQKQMYEIKGKLFNPLENCPHLSDLKEELGHLMTYFSNPLKQTHNYFKQLQYRVMNDYKDYDKETYIHDEKQQVGFSKRIHAIVKITEMEILPGCTLSGKWHVKGFSSDNILYTCLYVIEHDKNLVDGRLIFKRTPRADDVPINPILSDQNSHFYCLDYENLCDPHKLIPLGYLDIKEDLMIIFPNQNIHKVKGIRNPTNQPLKRKIIAFLIVNHIDQPFTINDVEFTQSIEEIEEDRFKDMLNRISSESISPQSFNFSKD